MRPTPTVGVGLFRDFGRRKTVIRMMTTCVGPAAHPEGRSENEFLREARSSGLDLRTSCRPGGQCQRGGRPCLVVGKRILPEGCARKKNSMICSKRFAQGGRGPLGAPRNYGSGRPTRSWIVRQHCIAKLLLSAPLLLLTGCAGQGAPAMMGAGLSHIGCMLPLGFSSGQGPRGGLRAWPGIPRD